MMTMRRVVLGLSARVCMRGLPRSIHVGGRAHVAVDGLFARCGTHVASGSDGTVFCQNPRRGDDYFAERPAALAGAPAARFYPVWVSRDCLFRASIG
jgi:hypothetical protein